MRHIKTRTAEALVSAFALLALAGGVEAQQLTGDRIATDNGNLIVHPIGHATFIMGWNGRTIYVDPVGGAEPFSGLPSPDLVLITDVHGDHMDVDTLQAVVSDATRIVAPAAVAEGLPAALSSKTTVVANGESQSLLGVTVEGVPMYNLTPERLQYHSKGRGNGYVVTLGGRRVYISGDTEDVPEMRALENIDAAFVCFNLPYTMTEEQAASAVREFAPEIVYPYHYRGSDVDAFSRLVGDASEVRVLDWY